MPVVVTRSPKYPLLVPAATNNLDAANKSAPQNPMYGGS